MKVIDINIADDHPVVVAGITNLLHQQNHFKVSATYETGAALLAGLDRHVPEVLLLDIHFPDTTGNALVRIISRKHPGLRILALSSVDNVFDVKDLMKNGCHGYLLKSAALPVLVEAIETVYRGDQFLEPVLKEQLLHSLLSSIQTKPLSLKLTQREQTLLELLAEGKTNNAIAAQLFLSHRTIENNRLSLYQKLGVKNTAELIKTAILKGFIK